MPSARETWMGAGVGEILVLGLGNTLLSDDGAGVHVIDALKDRLEGLESVVCRDGGTLGLELLPHVEEASGLVLVDASQIDGPPGTVRVFEGAQMDAQLGGRKRTAHEVAAADLMAAATLTGRRPERRALVAIQPKTTDWGLEPTAPVAQAIPVACTAILDLIDRWRA